MNQELLDSETREQLYKVLHDLCSPVKSMGGLLHLIKKAPTEEEKAAYFQPLETCYQEFDKRLHMLLDSIQGKQEPVEKINLYRCMVQIINTLRFLPGASDVRFSIEDHTKQPFYGPPNQVTSIFQNLIENSIKYRNPTSPEVTIRLYDTAEGIEAILSDNGPGIPYHQQQSIFNLFARSDDSDKGYGIGLYSVKTTLDNLNGHIELESTPGNGTVFRVWVPGR